VRLVQLARPVLLVPTPSSQVHKVLLVQSVRLALLVHKAFKATSVHKV